MQALPVTAGIEEYEAQAREAAEAGAEDGRLQVARLYDFRDWAALVAFVEGPKEFELAAEAVITGDVEGLRSMLRERPELVRERSARVTHFDPPVHRATLLHYIAANGVEGYRQKTPANAVEVARVLLDAGADPNALASMYGGECTVLPMLVSSSPPAEADLQVPLVEVLLDYGADVEGRGVGKWVSPLMTALAFGFRDAAEALVRRGARVERLAAAAGLGRVDAVAGMLAGADAEERHRALALSAQLGHAEVVGMLLDAGEDPDRFNPDGLHAHATPLHHAALNGHLEVVRLLVERGARVDVEDRIWKSTPLGWAEHGDKAAVAEYLRSFAAGQS